PRDDEVRRLAAAARGVRKAVRSRALKRRRPTARRSPMSNATPSATDPRWMLWTGRVLSFLVVAQLLSSAWFRGTQHTYAVAEIVTGYGYPESAIPRIVIAECVLVVLYLVPQTSVLAAIVMTGYLGGAVGA